MNSGSNILIPSGEGNSFVVLIHNLSRSSASFSRASIFARYPAANRGRLDTDVNRLAILGLSVPAIRVIDLRTDERLLQILG